MNSPCDGPIWNRLRWQGRFFLSGQKSHTDDLVSSAAPVAAPQVRAADGLGPVASALRKAGATDGPPWSAARSCSGSRSPVMERTKDSVHEADGDSYALAAGLAIGFSTPRTHFGDEYVGSTRDALAGRTAGAAEDVAQQVKERAKTAASGLAGGEQVGQARVL